MLSAAALRMLTPSLIGWSISRCALCGQVADAIAARYDISKSDVLSAESSNVAVRLALAETSLIQETKSFLEENGVSLGAFSGRYAAMSCVLISS